MSVAGGSNRPQRSRVLNAAARHICLTPQIKLGSLARSAHTLDSRTRPLTTWHWDKWALTCSARAQSSGRWTYTPFRVRSTSPAAMLKATCGDEPRIGAGVPPSAEVEHQALDAGVRQSESATSVRNGASALVSAATSESPLNTAVSGTAAPSSPRHSSARLPTPGPRRSRPTRSRTLSGRGSTCREPGRTCRGHHADLAADPGIGSLCLPSQMNDLYLHINRISGLLA